MPWCASAPHHITAVFIPYDSTSLLGAGSIGVGLAVEPRLRACLPGPEEPPTSTAARVVRLLQLDGGLGSFTMPLPPGKGYAVSATSAIATALAGVTASGRKVGLLEALQAAHKAEILERTGLGDVLAISCGVGMVMRLVPGAPGVGRAECVPVPRSVSVISLEGEGTLWTGRLLEEEYLSRGRRLAGEALRRVFEERSLEAFAEEATRYTEELGLAGRVLGGGSSVLRRVPGLIGYYAKKRLVVVLVESNLAGDALEVLEGLAGARARLLAPSERGVEVWWDYGS